MEQAGRLPPDWILPDWPVPAWVRGVTTSRQGGVSSPPFGSMNLAAHVGDDPAAVTENRRRLCQILALPEEPAWLVQVHGTRVVAAGEGGEGDGVLAREAGRVCAVLTADCLPVLFCNRAGSRVAAAHAGWRGLAAGVLEATVAAMEVPGSDLLAWLGPAIGPAAFEVGEEVREALTEGHPAAEAAFHERGGHWYADLYQLARQRLAAVGVTEVYGGGWCTHDEPERFFSYRRDGVTGRMATLVWIEPRGAMGYHAPLS